MSIPSISKRQSKLRLPIDEAEARFNVLVKVVQRAHTPGPPTRSKRFGQINSRGDPRDDRPETKYDPSRHEHPHILRRGLQEDADESDQTRVKHAKTSAEVISQHTADWIGFNQY